uniref:Uncharacterized protein n=1 Tax=Arundo donax TaxID=35708 RepID=A0A0A9BEM5_ARUDO
MIFVALTCTPCFSMLCGLNLGCLF